MKEKVDSILGGFLKRNKDYAIGLNINNAVTNNSIGRIFITSDWIYEANDKRFILKWNKADNNDVRYNEFSIPYDEVMKCYDTVEKEDKLKITETVVVILKNGMEFDFECCGMRLVNSNYIC